MEETDTNKESKRFGNIGLNTLHYRRDEKNIGIRACMYNIIVFIALLYCESSTKSYGLENTNDVPFHKNKLIKDVNSSDVHILPDSRIVAYYGNFESRKMGVLGEYSPLVMWSKLKNEAAEWNAADPTTPVIMALHYIAIVASNNPGYDGEYINRMNKYQIEKALSIAVWKKTLFYF